MKSTIIKWAVEWNCVNLKYLFKSKPVLSWNKAIVA